MLGHQFSVLSSSVERSSGVLVKLKQLFCPTASPLTPLTPLRLHTAQAATCFALLINISQVPSLQSMLSNWRSSEHSKPVGLPVNLGRDSSEMFQFPGELHSSSQCLRAWAAADLGLRRRLFSRRVISIASTPIIIVCWHLQTKVILTCKSPLILVCSSAIFTLCKKKGTLGKGSLP